MRKANKIIYIFPGVGRMSSRFGLIGSEQERYNRVFREQFIVKHTRELGYNCELFLPTCSKQERYTDDEVKAWFFPVDNPEDNNSNLKSTALLKKIETQKPDLVVFKGANLGLSRWLLINSKHRFRYAIIIGGTPTDLLIPTAEYLLAESDVQARHYLLKKYNQGKVGVLPKLLRSEDFCRNNEKKFDIINVGQFIRIKNQKALIPFFSKYRVALVGDGDCFDMIKEEADKYPDNVYMPGHIKRAKIPRLISQSKIMIHFSEDPNISRGSPARVSLEAFACGVPVVVKKKGVIAVIEHGVNGMIIEEDNLIREVKKLLSNDELVKKMGDNALEYALNNCNEQEVGRAIEGMYDFIFLRKKGMIFNHSIKWTPHILRIKTNKQKIITFMKNMGRKMGLKSVKDWLMPKQQKFF